MSIIFDGMQEIMWCSFKIKKNDLKNHDKESFISKIENTFQEQSLRLFATNIMHDITLEGNSIEVDFNKPEICKEDLDTDEMKIDIYEILEKSSVYLEDEINPNNLKLKIDTNQDNNIYRYGYDVFDDAEYQFWRDKEQLSLTLESESSGSVKRKLCYIKNADNKFIMDLTDEMDIQEVFSDLRTYLIQ